MPGWTALTTLKGEAAACRLADAIDGLAPQPAGVGVFEVEDGSGLWEVGGYFAEKPDVAALSLLALIHGAHDFALSENGDRDWVAEVRRELAPVRAGRFRLHGSHDRASGGGRFDLEIDAAMAFGTGHHGTTRGCLILLDRLARRGLVARRVADIGSGTGALAMAAARLWPARTIASDIDPVARETARVNARTNRLPGIRSLACAGFRHAELRREAPFDLIFANILANPLKRLAPEMARYAAPGGMLILSGILAEQAAGVEAVYRSHGFRRLDRLVLGDWVSLGLSRPSK
jgi:ribosomal protein L11 methyltransferase